MARGGIALLVLLFGALVVGSSALYTVSETQQAIVFQFGRPVHVERAPGLKFKLPFVQDVQYIEKRILSHDAAPAELVTSDKKRLRVDVFLRFRISDPLLFYQRVRTEANAARQLDTRLESSLRAVLGRQELTTIVSGERVSLMNEIAGIMTKNVKEIGLEVVDVRLKRADLPPENSEAVYRRMRTERERIARELRAQGKEYSEKIRAEADKQVTVLVAEANRKAELLRGEGDAKANRIYANAFNQDPEFFSFYRSMEAYRKSLGEQNTQIILSPQGDFFKYFGERSAR